MSASRVFVDANILIYAHDQDAGEKRTRAAECIQELWEQETGVISVQVLQEFYVNVTRKLADPLSHNKARGIVETYLQWQVVENTPGMVLQASEISERHQLSFWDAMIIAAAKKSGVDTLLSEDLNAGQSIEGITVTNPL